MKKILAITLAAAMAVVFSACGGSAPAPAAKEKAEKKKLINPEAIKAPAAKPAEPAKAAASEAPKQPDTNVNPAPAGGNKLVGSVWSMPDGTELTFKDGKILVKNVFRKNRPALPAA